MNQRTVPNWLLIANLFDRVDSLPIFYLHTTKPCFWVSNSTYMTWLGCILVVYLNKAMKVADQGGLQGVSADRESFFILKSCLGRKRQREKTTLIPCNVTRISCSFAGLWLLNSFQKLIPFGLIPLLLYLIKNVCRNSRGCNIFSPSSSLDAVSCSSWYLELKQNCLCFCS